MLELYHAGLTTCSKKVRLCLHEKALSYTSRFVSLARFEQHDPAYLRIHPDGVVPALVDGAVIVVESMLINEYLDEAYPDIQLRPHAPGERARMRYMTKLADNFGLASVQYLTEALSIMGRLAAEHGLRDEHGEIIADKLDELIGRIPVKAAKERWERLARGGLDQAEVRKAAVAAERILTRTEQYLEAGPWLMGQQFTLADIDVLPFVDRYEQYHPALLNAARTPLTMAWLERMRRRPTVQAVYSPSDEAPEVILKYRGAV